MGEARVPERARDAGDAPAAAGARAPSANHQPETRQPETRQPETRQPEGAVEPMETGRPRLDGASWATTPAIRRTMLGNRSRDTAPELRVRRAVHAMGLRYRVAYRPERALRRTADLVFTRARVAVFIDGCYWHGCPEHYIEPASNVDYWRPKIARNRERDAETTAVLTAAGWQVLRFWSHEDPDRVAAEIAAAVRPSEPGVQASPPA